MLMVISPAKTLDYETPPATPRFTQPEHLDHAQEPVSYTHLDVYKRQVPTSLQACAWRVFRPLLPMRNAHHLHAKRY